jgi:hypothetical protein
MAITVNLPKPKEGILVPRELKPDEKLKSGKTPLATSEKEIKPEDIKPNEVPKESN